jgi:hypothetical protein
MSPTERVAEVTASLQRCLKAPGFLDHFLDLLALRAPHLRECIVAQTGASQPVMARRCITTMLLAVGGAVPLEDARRKFAECRATGGFGMTAELFPVWAATLTDAVRRYDPEFGPEVEAAWHRVLDAAGRDVVLCGEPACGRCPP